MKFKTLSVLAVAVMAVAGGVSAHVVKEAAPTAEFSAKRTPVQKTRTTYQICMQEALKTCTAQHPNDQIAKWGCIEDIRARICETLPGAP